MILDGLWGAGEGIIHGAARLAPRTVLMDHSVHFNHCLIMICVYVHLLFLF